MSNKIYYNEQLSAQIFSDLQSLCLPKIRQHSEEKSQPSFNQIKTTSRSRQISLNKEIDYYVQQDLKQKHRKRQLTLKAEFEQFQTENKEFITTYVKNKLKKNFLNLKISDEQRETFAKKLSNIAIKHKQQIQEINNIQKEIHRKYEDLYQQQNAYYSKEQEVLETLPDVPKTHKLYNPNVLAQYQKYKYAQFWNKIPKSLA